MECIWWNQNIGLKMCCVWCLMIGESYVIQAHLEIVSIWLQNSFALRGGALFDFFILFCSNKKVKLAVKWLTREDRQWGIMIHAECMTYQEW